MLASLALSLIHCLVSFEPALKLSLESIENPGMFSSKNNFFSTKKDVDILDDMRVSKLSTKVFF